MSIYKILGIIFSILCLIFIGHYLIVGNGIYGDGIYYWATTRSLWKDHNLDLRNEIHHLYDRTHNTVIEKENFSGEIIRSWFPLGTSLSWIPAFGAADIISFSIHLFNPSYPNNGYSDIYQVFVGIFNIAFIIIGLFFLFKFLRFHLSTHFTWVVIITWLFGSNLLYYAGIDVINSHPFIFLLSCLYIYIWQKTFHKRSLIEWIQLGFILGCMSVTRTQELIFVLFLCADLIRMKKLLLPRLFGFFVAISIAAVVYFLQIIVWRYIYQTFSLSPYLSTGFAYHFPYLYRVLLDEKNGLLRWTPIYFFGFIGLYMPKNKLIWFYCLFFVSIQIILLSNWSGLQSGGAYGMRFLLSSSFAYCLGLGMFFEKISKYLRMRWVYLLATCIIILNILNILYFLLFVT